MQPCRQRQTAGVLAFFARAPKLSSALLISPLQSGSPWKSSQACREQLLLKAMTAAELRVAGVATDWPLPLYLQPDLQTKHQLTLKEAPGAVFP